MDFFKKAAQSISDSAKSAGDAITDTAKSAGEVIAPGIYVYNDTTIPILCVLSQLSPLHWSRIEPGEKKHIACGRVFFTGSHKDIN